MKLLLSGLYQLPLVQVPTYLGVKHALFETYNLVAGNVWCWRSFNFTTPNKQALLNFWQSNSFFGTDGKRTLFCINAVGVEIDKFHGMKNEKQVLLLPGLPLVNRPGKNPEP